MSNASLSRAGSWWVLGYFMFSIFPLSRPWADSGEQVWVLTLGPKYVLALKRKPDNCIVLALGNWDTARLPGDWFLSLCLFLIIAQFCPMEGLFYTWCDKHHGNNNNSWMYGVFKSVLQTLCSALPVDYRLGWCYFHQPNFQVRKLRFRKVNRMGPKPPELVSDGFRTWPTLSDSRFCFVLFLAFCAVYEILVPWPGIESSPPAWELGVLATGPLGKPLTPACFNRGVLQGHKVMNCLVVG